MKQSSTSLARPFIDSSSRTVPRARYESNCPNSKNANDVSTAAKHKKHPVV